jgi:serine/threonine protein phosphatase 1
VLARSTTLPSLWLHGEDERLELLAIVADVHGEASALHRALEHYTGSRHIVLVGDYVNRGPDSAEALAILADACESGEVTPLIGNHDHAFLDYLRTGQLAPFARLGGLATIKSYVGSDADDLHQALVEEIPADHVALLNGLHPSYENEELLVSHCGVSPLRPYSRDIRDLVLGSHPTLFDQRSPPLPKMVISGHYVQRSRSPFISRHYICVDAGCGTIQGAPLAVLEWPEQKFNYFEVR